MILFLPLLIGSSWQSFGWPCATQTPQAIAMECEAGALYGPALDLSHGLHVEVDLMAYAKSGDGRFWGSVAINHDIPADDRYASAGITQGIAPYWGDTEPYAVHLSTPASRCCDRLTPADASAWHHIAIDYTPGRATYQIDGVPQSAQIDLGDTAHVELVCVAVDPGETKPGNIAHCAFANLDIRPILSSPAPE